MNGGATHPAWKRYRPTDDAPWNAHRVFRLHRAAGFGASWACIQRDVARGPDAAISAVLSGSEPQIQGFQQRQARLQASATSSGRPAQLQAWWVYCMLHSGHPLRERLTLLWHDHFATSQQKVNQVPLMAQQNNLFREHGMGPFGPLLRAVVKDPALLLYLDAPANRQGRTNENLGRELLELFTLGVGNYDQKDVTEASRALTGWGVSGTRFSVREDHHDPELKTILGRTGAFDGDQLIDLTLAHPATATTLATKLCDEFLGEGAHPEDRAKEIEALAAGLRERALDVSWAVETILRSKRFHDGATFGRRFVGPVEFVLAAVRALELDSKLPSTMELAGWIARIGQNLFFPPNVGGWPQGRGWFTQRAVLSRANFIDALVGGTLHGSQHPGSDGPVDVAGLCRDHQGERFDHTTTGLAKLLCPLLTGNDSLEWIATVEGAADRPSAPDGPTMFMGAEGAARRLAVTILTSPDGQLT